MAIVRGFWHVLVGIKDLLVLILLLVFFIAVWSLLSGRAPLQIPGGAALVLNVDGAIVDQSAERSALQTFTGTDIGAEREVRDYIRAIDTAAKDYRIKALVIDLDTFVGAGQANLQSIGSALGRFKKAGKPINAYATAYTDDGYYLAAFADKIWVNPLGGVLFTGPGGSNLYFKTALD